MLEVVGRSDQALDLFTTQYDGSVRGKTRVASWPSSPAIQGHPKKNFSPVIAA